MGKKNQQVKTREKKSKWDFAVGTTSRVPDCDGVQLHYLILDIDEFFVDLGLLDSIGGVAKVQKTKHGYHIYTNLVYGFSWCCELAEMFGADKAWIRIAKTRGYFFLADKNLIDVPWPVERMAIHCRRKNT